jgi:predicted DNA-binding transcriptional regulator YafY
MSTQTLAELLEVSPRTVSRYVESLGLAGVPVNTCCGVNGGIELMPGYSPERSLFTKGDLSRLITALSAASSAGCIPNIDRLFDKVRSIMPDDNWDDAMKLHEQVVLDLRPWFDSKERSSKLEQIEQAIQQRRVLRIEYCDSGSHASMREIEPHVLVLKGSSWYLYAWCRLRNAFRIFRLSRIQLMESAKETFQRREADVSASPWNEVWDKPGSTITLKLRLDDVARARAIEIFPEEDFIPKENGWFEAEIRVLDNSWIYEFILGCGTHMEVLEPAVVRDTLRESARKLLELYT